jgi:hypothetical protein
MSPFVSLIIRAEIFDFTLYSSSSGPVASYNTTNSFEIQQSAGQFCGFFCRGCPEFDFQTLAAAIGSEIL